MTDEADNAPMQTAPIASRRVARASAQPVAASAEKRGPGRPKKLAVDAETANAGPIELASAQPTVARDAEIAPQNTQAAAALTQMAEPETEADEPVVLTRRSRLSNAVGDFDVPEEYKKDGWDYEWKTTRVNGQDVDGADMAFIHENGWRAVPAHHMPKMCAPGYKGKTIERRGQILCMRPMHLTLEARAEEYAFAEKEKHDKLMAASAVPTARPGLVNPFKTEISFEGEVGTHREKSAAERKATAA